MNTIKGKASQFSASARGKASQLLLAAKAKAKAATGSRKK
jgi:hypothetical protein